MTLLRGLGVEGLLGNETSIPKGSTYYEIDGNKAVDFSNGTILYAWDGKMYTAHNGMWTEVT